ncbi:hypothetical protein HID58_032323 [Brassica napus]|uniref:Uncharacterized protein n=1 Tax=Brassica napus TaxID=3708 RepID=A0ABQ8BW08_BRANA|nr:hypothetical protein HID58_032323 [Brassica napus]
MGVKQSIKLLDENDSPLSLVKVPSMVEPLRTCGHRVFALVPPVTSKRTPWPDFLRAPSGEQRSQKALWLA